MEGQEYLNDDNLVVESESNNCIKNYIGFDFGNTNTYLALFSEEEKNEYQHYTFRDYTISDDILKKLSKIEKIDDEEIIKKDYLDNINLAVSESLKIEDQSVNVGETISFPSKENIERRSEEDELKKHHSALNLKKAFEVTFDGYKDVDGQFELFIKGLNNLILDTEHAGDYRKQDVIINKAVITPTSHYEIRNEINKLKEYLKNNSSSNIEKAFVTHHAIVSIHPFIDGNGRTARLLLNASANVLWVSINYN